MPCALELAFCIRALAMSRCRKHRNCGRLRQQCMNYLLHLRWSCSGCGVPPMLRDWRMYPSVRQSVHSQQQGHWRCCIRIPCFSRHKPRPLWICPRTTYCMLCRDDGVSLVLSLQESENAVSPLLQPRLHLCLMFSQFVRPRPRLSQRDAAAKRDKVLGIIV